MAVIVLPRISMIAMIPMIPTISMIHVAICRSGIERPHRDDPHHACMHMKQQVAMKRPVADMIG